MNKKNIIFVFLFIILFICLGPRVKFKNEFTKMETPTSLSEIDNYLLEKEAAFKLEPNTRKEIFWFDGAAKKTEYGVVYIHGFGASRNEVYPIPNNIAKSLKANIFFTRLKGHGIADKDAFKGVQTSDWLSDIDEAIQIGKLISEKLILIGTSNGGAASIWVLENYPDDINSVVLMAPNIYPKDSRTNIIYYPWGKQLAYLITGGYNKSADDEEKRIQHNTVKRFDSEFRQVDAIISMMGLIKLINSKDFSEIKTPMIVIRTPNDETVDPKGMYEFTKEYGGIKKDIPIILIEDTSSHVPVGNYNYRKAQNTSYFVKDSIEFIKELNK